MVSGRALETATALLTGAFGVAVVVSSLDNGIGWSAAGVDAGSFPFTVGLIILGGSVFNLVQGWLHARDVVLRPSELQAIRVILHSGGRLCRRHSVNGNSIWPRPVMCSGLSPGRSEARLSSQPLLRSAPPWRSI